MADLYNEMTTPWECPDEIKYDIIIMIVHMYDVVLAIIINNSIISLVSLGHECSELQHLRSCVRACVRACVRSFVWRSLDSIHSVRFGSFYAVHINALSILGLCLGWHGLLFPRSWCRWWFRGYPTSCKFEWFYINIYKTLILIIRDLRRRSSILLQSARDRVATAAEQRK